MDRNDRRLDEGEEKSRKQNRCYYGADGKLQKVPIEGQPKPEGKSPRGIRGKVVSNKKEDIGETMQEAVALVKEYIPPDAARIQAAKDAGKVTITPPDPAGRLQVKITDYLKAGDSMTIDIDAAKNSLLGIAVASYMKKEKEAVTMQTS